jgi:hypothetical protein
MEFDSETELHEAVQQLSAIVQGAQESDLFQLLDEDVAGLAARVADAGVCDLDDEQIEIRPHSLAVAINYYFVTGVACGQPANLERSQQLRLTLEAAGRANAELASEAAALRDEHARYLNVFAASTYLAHAPGRRDEGLLLRADQLARLAMDMARESVTWRSAACTLLAVAKTSAEENGDPEVLTDAINMGRELYEYINAPGTIPDDIDADILANLGACLRFRGDRADDEECLAEAVRVLQTAVRIASGRPGEALARLNLSQALYTLADARNDPVVADQAFIHVRAAATAVPDGDRQHYRYLKALGDAWMRYADTDAEAAPAAALAYAEAARIAPEGRFRFKIMMALARSCHRVFVADPSDTEPERLLREICTSVEDGWVASASFAQRLAEDHVQDGGGVQLDTAVMYADRAVRRSDRHPLALMALGLALVQRGRSTAAAADAERAVATYREVLQVSARGEEAGRNAGLVASALAGMYRRGEDPAIPDLCLSVLREVGAARPGFSTHLALAKVFGARFKAFREPSDRQDALQAWRELRRTTPEDPEPPSRLFSLLVDVPDVQDLPVAEVGEVLTLVRWFYDRDPANPAYLHRLALFALLASHFPEHFDAVRDTVGELRTALGEPPWSESQLPVLLTQISLLQVVFEEAEDTNALTEAVNLAGQVATQPDLPHSFRAEARTARAQVLLRQFEFSGNPDDVKDAIDELRSEPEAERSAAEAERPNENLSDTGVSKNARLEDTRALALAMGLTSNYLISGAVSDLEESVTLYTRVLENHESDDRATALSNLGLALRLRAEHYDDPVGLHQAFDACRESVSLTPSTHRERPRRVIQIASVALSIAQSYDDQDRARGWSDLAVNAAREALATAPDGHSEESRFLQALAAALLVRQQIARAAGDSADAVDFEEAIDIYAHVVDSTKPGHMQHSVALFNLAAAHLRRWQRTGGPVGVLESAASYARRMVVAEGAGWLRHASSRILLSRVLEELALHTNNSAHAREAASYLREAAQAPDGPPERRLEASVRWGNLEVREQRQRKALQAWSTAVELLPLVVWFGLDRPLQESHLRRYEGVAREAAAAALDAGQPELAVASLEQGRNVLWSGLLRTRTSLDDVQATHPELARDLRAVRARLNALDRAAASSAPTLALEPQDGSD